MMFQPIKLLPFALAVILLAPLGFVFWRFITYQPRPDVERRAEVEALLYKRSAERGTRTPDGTFIGGIGVSVVEGLAFSRGTASWLNFFPRLWVGVVGLVAIAVILACIALSLFVPSPVPVSISQRAELPQPSLSSPQATISDEHSSDTPSQSK